MFNNKKMPDQTLPGELSLKTYPGFISHCNSLLNKRPDPTVAHWPAARPLHGTSRTPTSEFPSTLIHRHPPPRL